MFKVEHKSRIDRHTADTGLKVEVRTCRTTSVTTKTDYIASANNLVRLAKVLAEVAIDSLKAVGVTNNNVVTIAVAFKFHDAHLAIECSANSIANIYLDVKTCMSASPAWTILGSNQTVCCWHVEATEIDLEVCWSIAWSL